MHPLRLALVSGCAAAAALAPLHGKSDRHRVIWIDSPATSAVIGWNQAGGENAVLHYGTTDHGGDSAAYPLTSSPSRQELYMEMDNRFSYLTGLEPDTAYYFVIADSEGVSERLWFRTAPSAPKAFTFIAGGDTKSEDEARARGRLGNRLVAKLRPLFVLFDGDFTSGDGSDAARWRTWLDDWTKDTVSEDGRIYPIVPVRGNHEADPEFLYRLFGLKDPNHYFAFTAGGDLLRVYVLNSQIHVTRDNADKGGNSNETRTPAAETQTNWLVEDLEWNKSTTFKIAAYHKPMRPHTKGKPDNDYLYDSWAATFYRYRLTMAVEGDSHMHKITYPVRPSTAPGSVAGFIRDDTKGTMFVGEGSWGANTRPNDDDKPWTLHSANAAQLKWIHVYPDHMALHTVLTENAGDVAPNTEENVFTRPANLRLVEAPGFGAVIQMPFQRNTPTAGK